MRYTEVILVAFSNSQQARLQGNAKRSTEQPRKAIEMFRNWKIQPCLSSAVPIAMKWDDNSPRVIESKEGVL